MDRNRKALKLQYKKLYEEIASILFKHDLMGINFEDNIDEYEPEVDTILPRLKDAVNQEDVAIIIYEEFVRWFGKDIVRNQDHPKYTAMAIEIWELWLKHNRP